MRILVTGGAGYIGSITIKALQKQGIDAVVFDNLVQGHRDAVSCPLIVGDLLDREKLFSSLSTEHFDGVIHFAAYLQVGESMTNPYKYFQNNIQGGLNLLELMKEKKVPYIVFSSTSAIYGTPKVFPVREDEEKKPESVYGETKLAFEKILHWYDAIYGIKSICLRYFNAAGASLDGTLGERHNPETHIVPVAIHAALAKEPFLLFGTNYDTPDGTCIRDYIHVEDLAAGHILALQKLKDTNTSNNYNLGTGRGYSNLEVLEMIKKISGINLQINSKPKRTGDLPIIYADNSKAKNELGFNPQYSDLETIVKTAWEFHSKIKK